jgi:hypothetical protein
MAIDGNGNKVVQAKVLQVAYTTAEWAEATTAAKVISRGQIVAELTTTGKTKLKMGDGVNTFANLPYVTGDVEVDDTLSITGQAADAKATGDAITNLRNTGTTISITGDVAAEGVSFNLGDTIALNTTVQSVAANKITGVLALENIPQGALERLVIVANEAARLALTTAQVQNGDVVKEEDTGLMYFVKDDTKLGTAEAADAFEEFTAGTASAVEWTNVQNKPFETLDSIPTAGSNNPVTSEGIANALANKVDVVTGKGLSTNDFTDTYKGMLDDPSTIAVTGIKGSSGQAVADKGVVTVDKAYVGLGNVTNDAQVKGLDSGTTAGNVVAWGADGYTVADSGVAAANVVVDTDTLILNCTL